MRPSSRRDSAIRSLVSGELRAKISSSPPRSRESSSRIGHPVDLGALNDAGIIPADADPSRDRRRRQPVVSGDHDHPQPRLVAALDRGRDLRSRWIEHRDQSQEGEVGLGLLPLLGALPPSRARSATASTLAPGRVSVHDRLDPVALRRRSAGAPRRPQRSSVQRGSTASGAPFESTQRRPPRSSTVDISRSEGSKWKSARRSRSRSAASTSDAEPYRGLQDRHLGRVADELAVPIVELGVVAGDHAGGELSQPAVSPFGRASPGSPFSRLSEPGGVQIVVALIRFSVRVPVLSVQMTLVEPRVSTALSLLTTAPRRTRSLAPTARARVITGSSPSGTRPTRSPTAKTTGRRSRAPPPASPSG